MSKTQNQKIHDETNRLLSVWLVNAKVGKLNEETKKLAESVMSAAEIDVMGQGVTTEQLGQVFMHLAKDMADKAATYNIGEAE